MGTGDLLDEFAAGYDFAFDDFQVQACHEVQAGRGVLVAAPTGSGKTVVGEFAAWCALRQGRKCFYTTPIKALSNQKYHDLVARHGELRVGLLTGDTSINGEADIVVMTTEVLRNMIYAGSPTLSGLGFVVMDEVHYLADRFRGPVWEEVILGLADSVQIVALSATVSNAEEFGEWLGAVRGETAVVVSERRPVPLYQHVMVGYDLIDLFEHSNRSGERGVNPKLLTLAQREARETRDDARRPRGRSGRGQRNVSYGSGSFGGAANTRYLKGARQHNGPPDGERKRSLTPSRGAVVRALEDARLLPAIVFVFSRAGCDGAVRQLLTSGVRLTSRTERAELASIAAQHGAALSATDRAALGWESFVEALTRGIAAHHAGLLPVLKTIVEQAFTRGLVKVVYATETLALGINMPARTVVIERLVKYNGEGHVDVTPGEYTQLTGRAGRRGIDDEGHAVVAWQPGMDPRAVAGLASRRTYPLKSSFRPTYNMAVNLVGSMGRDRARALLEQSFAQFQTDRTVVGMARQSASNKAVIDEYLAQAQCDRGDFTEYARLRDRISQLESRAARLRKQDRRAEAMESLLDLVPGDVVWAPGGRHQGWVVVVDPGIGRDHEPHPLVLTEDRQLVRLTIQDFPDPATSVARLRIPKKFDPRNASARKALAASLRQKIEQLPVDVAPAPRQARDAQLAAEIDQLRTELRAHPCHECPDRETHARFAEKALVLERESSRIRERAQTRTNSIASQFDRICGVLTSLGYLTDDDQVTESGRMLCRIYNELDLVVAECVRGGVFDGLGPAPLAAVLSTLVYEARAGGGQLHRMPDPLSETAASQVRATWREVGLVERDFRVERQQPPEIGFAEAAYDWAGGAELAEVLENTQLPAGDFVRWVRQVVDLAGQISAAPGVGDLRLQCQAVVAAMRRDIVELDTDE